MFTWEKCASEFWQLPIGRKRVNLNPVFQDFTLFSNLNSWPVTKHWHFFLWSHCGCFRTCTFHLWPSSSQVETSQSQWSSQKEFIRKFEITTRLNGFHYTTSKRDLEDLKIKSNFDGEYLNSYKKTLKFEDLPPHSSIILCQNTCKIPPF